MVSKDWAKSVDLANTLLGMKWQEDMMAELRRIRGDNEKIKKGDSVEFPMGHPCCPPLVVATAESHRSMTPVEGMR